MRNQYSSDNLTKDRFNRRVVSAYNIPSLTSANHRGFFLPLLVVLKYYLYICGIEKQIDMAVIQKTVKIIHPEHGSLLEDTFLDEIQFKLFLKLIHSCLELKQDLTTFNGVDFLLHVPYKLLSECMILGNTNQLSLGEYATQKAKIEE